MSRFLILLSALFVASPIAAMPVTFIGNAADDGPVLARTGPYGDPLMLEPRPPLDGRAVELALPIPDRSGTKASGPSLRLGAVRHPKDDSGDDADDPNDEDLPLRPGALSRSFVALPNPTPNLKSRSLGQHLVPDAEYELSDRATLGFLGRVDSVDPRTGGTGNGLYLTSRGLTMRDPVNLAATRSGSAAPTSKAKDLGLGMSLEFKLP